MIARRTALAACAVLVATVTLSGEGLGQASRNPRGVPKVLNNRLVVGEPLWRELPVRSDFQSQHDRVWQTALNTILEHGFDIATMEKDSGYLRTTPNERIVRLQTDWFYKVQISLKLVSTPADPVAKTPMLVTKVRLQVSGEVTNVDPRKGLKVSFLGYDLVLLQSLFQDLQAKLGAV